VFDVESAILTGTIIERQKESETGEWKYVISGEAVDRRALSVVAKFGDLDFEAAGSTTFKREVLKRGFEPDSSFYIKNAAHVRGKKRLDMEIDPPPELIVEIDVTNDSMNKFPLYAALRIPEVWRYAGGLEIWILDEGRYIRSSASVAIPILSEKLISELMESSLAMERPAWERQTRKRILELRAKS